MIFEKEAFGILSLLLNAMSGIPYIYFVLKGKTRPHVFTWILWGVLAAIAAAAQGTAQAGPGNWTVILSAVLSLITAALAFSHGDRGTTRGDWVAFIIGLAAIPLWYVTANPLAAVILVTISDGAGYIPTIRKSWMKPREEMVSSYGISNLKHFAAIAATSSYSATTLVYPVALSLMNGALIAVLLWRRRILK